MSVAEIKLDLIRIIDTLPPAVLPQAKAILEKLAVHDTENTTDKVRFGYGALKGQLLYMAPDFDASLEDLKDYM